MFKKKTRRTELIATRDQSPGVLCRGSAVMPLQSAALGGRSAAMSSDNLLEKNNTIGPLEHLWNKWSKSALMQLKAPKPWKTSFNRRVFSSTPRPVIPSIWLMEGL